MRPRFLSLLIVIVTGLTLIGVGVWYLMGSLKGPMGDKVEIVKEDGVTFTKDVREMDYLSLDLTYPADSIATARITEYVHGLRDEYLNDYGSLSTNVGREGAGLFEGQKALLSIATRVASSTRTTSYILEVYEYTGGAHGITSIHTFTYDMKGNFISFDDYFTPATQTAALNLLSNRAHSHFKELLGEDTTEEALREGTAPRKENFTQWYLRGDSVVFVFGQYAIGSYALGIQEFSIPQSDLAQFVNPLYR